MQLVIQGKKMEVSPRLRQHIERKIHKLSRLVDEETRVEVTIEEQTHNTQMRYSVHIAVSGGSFTAHSEVIGANASGALDGVLDKVTAQVGRQKGRQTSIVRHRTSPIKTLALSRTGLLSSLEEEVNSDEEDSEPDGASAPSNALAHERNEEIWSRVLEIRRVQTKPMNDKEAIAQMEVLGLGFYPFINEATDTVNVMYRLEKGGYGLLVPALA